MRWLAAVALALLAENARALSLRSELQHVLGLEAAGKPKLKDALLVIDWTDAIDQSRTKALGAVLVQQLGVSAQGVHMGLMALGSPDQDIGIGQTEATSPEALTNKIGSLESTSVTPALHEVFHDQVKPGFVEASSRTPRAVFVFLAPGALSQDEVKAMAHFHGAKICCAVLTGKANARMRKACSQVVSVSDKRSNAYFASKLVRCGGGVVSGSSSGVSAKASSGISSATPAPSQNKHSSSGSNHHHHHHHNQQTQGGKATTQVPSSAPTTAPSRGAATPAPTRKPTKKPSSHHHHRHPKPPLELTPEPTPKPTLKPTAKPTPKPTFNCGALLARMCGSSPSSRDSDFFRSHCPGHDGHCGVNSAYCKAEMHFIVHNFCGHSPGTSFSSHRWAAHCGSSHVRCPETPKPTLKPTPKPSTPKPTPQPTPKPTKSCHERYVAADRHYCKTGNYNRPYGCPLRGFFNPLNINCSRFGQYTMYSPA